MSRNNKSYIILKYILKGKYLKLLGCVIEKDILDQQNTITVFVGMQTNTSITKNTVHIPQTLNGS